jgi:hypothetical protein
MNTSDKLSQFSILIRQFEFRNNRDDLDYLISISKNVLEAFKGCELIKDRAEVIANKLMSILPFAGTNKKDPSTLNAFDEYKYFLLTEIKMAMPVLTEKETAEVGSI